MGPSFRWTTLISASDGSSSSESRVPPRGPTFGPCPIFIFLLSFTGGTLTTGSSFVFLLLLTVLTSKPSRGPVSTVRPSEKAVLGFNLSVIQRAITFQPASTPLRSDKSAGYSLHASPALLPVRNLRT